MPGTQEGLVNGVAPEVLGVKRRGWIPLTVEKEVLNEGLVNGGILLEIDVGNVPVVMGAEIVVVLMEGPGKSGNVLTGGILGNNPVVLGAKNEGFMPNVKEGLVNDAFPLVLGVERAVPVIFKVG